MRTLSKAKIFIALWLLAVAVCVSLAEDANASMYERLSELGYLESYDGDIDEEALTLAVFNFQKANAIPASGIIDPTTAEGIMSKDALSFTEYAQKYLAAGNEAQALSIKDNGRQVRHMQTRLTELGYYAGEINGQYNMETACAVALFETVNGIEPDGVADAATMSKLTSPSAIALAGFEHMETLSLGDKGANVKYMQLILSELGYFEGECTGLFGENTRDAVISFEQHNGLEPTGVWTILYTVTAKNGRAMNKISAESGDKDVSLANGDSGYAVKELKRRLKYLGYYSGEVDDKYGDRTQSAITAFQEANGLTMSGVADNDTRQRLFRDDCVTMSEFLEICQTCRVDYGDYSYAVYLITRRLQALSYPVETQWDYNDNVAAAVTVFQYAQGFEAVPYLDEDMRKLMNSDQALSYSEAKPIADEVGREADERSRLESFMSYVRAAIGKPYEAGQTGPDSFGVGGFTYYCYAFISKEMAPTAAMQLDAVRLSGELIEDATLASEGCQIFFKDETLTYTGICTDESTLIYASPLAGFVVEVSLDDILLTYEFLGFVAFDSGVSDELS